MTTAAAMAITVARVAGARNRATKLECFRDGRETVAVAGAPKRATKLECPQAVREMVAVAQRAEEVPRAAAKPGADKHRRNTATRVERHLNPVDRVRFTTNVMSARGSNCDRR
jgi:hypothetical protein